MIRQQQNAKKIFNNKIEEQQQKLQETPKHQQILTNGTSALHKQIVVEPSKQRLEMNATLDEMSDKFQQSLNIEAKNQQKISEMNVIKPEKLELEKENIDEVGRKGKKNVKTKIKIFLYILSRHHQKKQNLLPLKHPLQ